MVVDLKVTSYDVADRVAVLTLRRPHRLNAWTGRMHTEYRWVLDQAERDPDVRVIVVTGEGRGFCAGADAEALKGHVAKGRYDDGITEPLAEPGFGVRPEFDHPFAFQFGMTKPIIAAVNGPAAGVGMAIACFADLRFAAESAKFTTAAPKLGLPAEFGLSWLLPRLVGVTHAADLLLSGRLLPADEAARIGLVNRVVADADLRHEVHDYAAEMAHHVSPSSLRETKAQLYADLHDDLGTSVNRSVELLERMMTEPDFVEGATALGEKRPPEF
jgi:enoyl-CoA hydratase/carnithine racemase